MPSEFVEHRGLMLPPALEKALSDPFSYALELKNGMVIEFTEASIHGRFIHLDGVDHVHDRSEATNWRRGEINQYPNFRSRFERGIDVALDEIVWVCDAPQGS